MVRGDLRRQAGHRHRQLVERGHALQRPPAGPGRARETRRAGRRRLPAGVPDDFPGRVLPLAHVHVLPQSHVDGRRGDDPRAAHRRRGAHVRLRQDHPGHAHGRGVGRSAGHPADGRAATQGQLARRRTRLLHRLPPLLVGTARRDDHAGRVRLHGGGHLQVSGTLHGDGYGFHDGRNHGSPRHDPARAARPFPARMRAAAPWPRPPGDARSAWSKRERVPPRS